MSEKLWSGPEDIRRQLMRRWDRGDLLRDCLGDTLADDVSDESSVTERFPLRVPLKGPRASNITENFQGVRNWVTRLTGTTAPIRIEWAEVRNRVQGSQRLPVAVWIDSLEQALRWLGKEREAARFKELVHLTQHQIPALTAWMRRHPLRVLDLAQDWVRLLSVVQWLHEHPRPAIYLRQVDIAGVHTKFLEAHRSVLIELLDIVLSPAQIDIAQTGVGRFASRYGFREKPVRIRFRVLDPGMEMFPGIKSPDVTLDAGSFARLRLDLQRVIITENEVNFLALPAMPGTLAMFGSGYGWESLAEVEWLHECVMDYWGDVDTHGFAILDRLRAFCPHVRSVLMDRDTLMAHKPYWVQEPRPFLADLHRLTRDELALFDDLRDNRLGQSVRLEQELVGYEWAQIRLMGRSPG